MQLGMSVQVSGVVVMKKIFCSLVGVVLMLPNLATFYAAESAGTLSVGASIVDSCSISAASLAFGVIDPLGNAGNHVDATAAVLVSCANGTAYHIALDGGGATTTTRSMNGENGTLNYALYSDANRTANWGNNVGIDTVADTGTGEEQALTVYGRVPSGQQNAPAGTYSDTITVTVTY